MKVRVCVHGPADHAAEIASGIGDAGGEAMMLQGRLNVVGEAIERPWRSSAASTCWVNKPAAWWRVGR
jgi:hypothetical protein